MGIVVYYYTYYSLVGSTRAYWQGSGRAAARGHFPKAVCRPNDTTPKFKLIFLIFGQQACHVIPQRMGH